MTPKTLRLTIIGLLMVTGVFHLAVAIANIEPGLGWPLAAFGALYSILGFYVRRDTNDGSKSHSRNAIVAAMAACTLGLTGGGYYYLANGGSAALPIMFAIDAVIIAAGALWLLKMRRKA